MNSIEEIDKKQKLKGNRPNQLEVKSKYSKDMPPQKIDFEDTKEKINEKSEVGYIRKQTNKVSPMVDDEKPVERI